MDKPSQTKAYAGLLIYRNQRKNVIEFLLLNDSFAKKKHWICPRGLVIGNEDEIKCALRETFEATGLRPIDLTIEESFAVELTYLSGTKPKRVKYYLAKMVDSHVRLLPNAQGVQMQWCNQTVASEKAVFKSMQDVFKLAQKCIESKPQQQCRGGGNNKQQQRQYADYQRDSSNSISKMNEGLGLAAAAAVCTKERGSTDINDGRLDGNTAPVSAAAAAAVESADENNQVLNNKAKQYRPRNVMNNGNNQPQQPPSSQQVFALRKTRLCESFETEGTCPYGAKCHFAHGIDELQQGDSSAVHSMVANDLSTSPATDAGNQLFKTRLCTKFMKERFCQYGPKCHFAHSEEELKTRPKKAEDIENGNPIQLQLQRNHANENNTFINTQIIQEQQRGRKSAESYHDYSRLNNRDSSHSSWRSQQQPNKEGSDFVLNQKSSYPSSFNNNHYNNTNSNHRAKSNQQSNRAYSSSSEEEAIAVPTNISCIDRSTSDNTSWRTTTPLSSPKTPLANSTHNVYSSNKVIPRAPTPTPTEKPQQEAAKKQDIVIPASNIVLPTDNLVRSAPIEKRNHQNSNGNMATAIHKKPSTHSINSNSERKDKKGGRLNTSETTDEKSWMKIVKLSKEEQEQMENEQQHHGNSNKSNGSLPASKLAQIESIIHDLKKFFINHTTVSQSNTTKGGKLAEDVKEVTKVEMRNDISKKQLLYILLVSLLEDSSDQSIQTVLKPRDHLFKAFVKNNADQMLLLKAWENFATQRKPVMVNKTAATLSHWYECEMIEEEAFIQWYETLQKGSTLESKSSKFIEWLLNSSDEE